MKPVCHSFLKKKSGGELVSISTNILNAGESLFLKSLVNDSYLSGLRLYGVAGNEVYRNSVSGRECTLTLPVAAGVYVLSIELENKLSEEFRILVK